MKKFYNPPNIALFDAADKFPHYLFMENLLTQKHEKCKDLGQTCAVIQI